MDLDVLWNSRDFEETNAGALNYRLKKEDIGSNLSGILYNGTNLPKSNDVCLSQQGMLNHLQ